MSLEMELEMDFEGEMKRLEEIAAKMAGEIPLEESLKLYTEAVELSKKLSEYIRGAKLKIEQLEAQ
ncbi:MAG: exodeoxyribonuclease VII small subunit [Oscillospiraceae bacterium]|nr:exodeoxyribonuclease VII small subunit [Oscillospiraceae bacterium]